MAKSQSAVYLDRDSNDATKYSVTFFVRNKAFASRFDTYKAALVFAKQKARKDMLYDYTNGGWEPPRKVKRNPVKREMGVRDLTNVAARSMLSVRAGLREPYPASYHGLSAFQKKQIDLMAKALKYRKPPKVNGDKNAWFYGAIVEQARGQYGAYPDRSRNRTVKRNPVKKAKRVKFVKRNPTKKAFTILGFDKAGGRWYFTGESFHKSSKFIMTYPSMASAELKMRDIVNQLPHQIERITVATA